MLFDPLARETWNIPKIGLCNTHTSSVPTLLLWVLSILVDNKFIYSRNDLSSLSVFLIFNVLMVALLPSSN